MKEDVVTHKNSVSLHIISALIALLIYLLMVLLLIGGFRFYKEKVKHEGGEKAVMSDVISNESIELAAVVPQKEESPEQEPKKVEQKEVPQTPEKNVQPQTPSPKPTQANDTKEVKETKEVNLADMFANISSKTSQDVRKEEEAKRRQELAEMKKQQDDVQKARQAQLAQNAMALEQSTRALQQVTQNLNSNIKRVATTKVVLEKPKFSGNAEDKKKYEAWYAQIEQILMSEWQKSGSFYQAATSAKVRIRIDSGGKLTYLFMVEQSPYGDYNDSVIAFLRKMGTRLFPPPPGDGVDMSMTLENTMRH